jgi:ergothioneine biosynthesis protein EgtB
MDFAAASIDDAEGMRHAGRDLLSLALIEARNRTLTRLALFEGRTSSMARAEFDPPAWLAGQCAWFQEVWIQRNPQRGRGEAADRRPLRIAGIEAQADAWYDPQRSTRSERWQPGHFGDPTDTDQLFAYLVATQELTQDLLSRADESDAGLYFYRLALLHEDRIGETLAELAQVCGIPDPRSDPKSGQPGLGSWPQPVARAMRSPLVFPAQRCLIGSLPGGLVPDNEKWAHDFALPEFEIDAQVVNWAQFAEFVIDGGYDEPRWWSAPGWAWVQASARRAPRHVEQVTGAVLLRRHGLLQRAPAAQAAVHVNAHEAAAWCSWAGRRLPIEAEWEAAACRGAGLGFAWGDVFEWTASPARPWAGCASGPAALDEIAADDSRQALRGASVFTVKRLKHPRARRFAAPTADSMFCGFRSCAI